MDVDQLLIVITGLKSFSFMANFLTSPGNFIIHSDQQVRYLSGFINKDLWNLPQKNLIQQSKLMHYWQSRYFKFTQRIKDYNATLVYNIEFIKKKINEQVQQTHHELIAGVKDLGSMNSLVTNVTSQCKLLKQNYQELNEQITAPYQQMTVLTNELDTLSKKTDSLRLISKFLTMYGRLMGVWGNVDEYHRAALYISELGEFSLYGLFSPIQIDLPSKLTLLLETIQDENHLSNLKFIQTEIETYKDCQVAIEMQGMSWLNQGLIEQNATILGKGVTIFANLNKLPGVVKGVVDGFLSVLEQESITTFDMASLNQEMTELKQKDKTNKNQSQLVAWASILWNRTEHLTDKIYTNACQLHTLEQYLTRRKNIVSQKSYLEIVLQEFKWTSLKNPFWTQLSQQLEDQIKKATKGSQFLLQVLQAGYPKLLRIFTDLFSRIQLLNGSNEKNPETVLLMKTLSSFEAAYVSRSLNRLLETVNVVIPERATNKAFTNSEDANRLSRTISSELNAVKFDPHLLKSITKNVSKTLTLFLAKLSQAVNIEPLFSITGAIISSNQLQRIEAINCIHSLSENVWKLVEDYESTSAEDSLYESCQTIINLLQTHVEPIFKNLATEIEQVINKMHKEDYAGNKPPSIIQRSSDMSSYMTEYLAKIRWVFRELVSKLQCRQSTANWAKAFCERIMLLHLRHVSLLKSNEAGKLKISGDMTQLEYVLSQSLSIVQIQLEDLSTLHQFKTFKKLLFLDLDKIQSSSHLDSIYVANHLLSRQPLISPPTTVFGWTEMEYVAWIDSHSELELHGMINQCLEVYMAQIERDGAKETCLEVPVLRTILMDWENLQ
ncbi:hypothetical protein BC833DRAFT_620715 [Globomyces pollinis-pini]|nr:hypothetical protein BC833DRAFT_620715 [Globomyces pollinis-pini]